MLQLQVIALTALLLLTAARSGPAQEARGDGEPAGRIPVIFDTDIGDDIDDTWALVMLLRSPELDLKLALADHGKADYRARIMARMLEIAGRTDVPIGLGVGGREGTGRQAAWVEGYALEDYPGTVHEDGVGAMIETIMNSPTPVTVLCIGPVPNIPAALVREPRIVENARFVGMHGSLRLGYGGSETVSAEYNVRERPTACREAFEAGWEITITPLDTCGIVRLDGERFRRLHESDDPLLQALMENYRVWARSNLDPTSRSSVLFDTVAVYLAFSEELLEIEELPVVVTDDGYTRIDEAGTMLRAATRWRDLDGYLDFLVDRLAGVR
ncbi:MAG: nucleoside hydrolase [Armatimonadota bacterium]